jgi:SOS response regulatory protein OraA/RecX
MKYLVLIPDGMADEKIAALDNKTPMEYASKPIMDLLAEKSIVGVVSNVPEGMVPESDTANMAILSFDPKIYSKGRSPLEAFSMGLRMTDTQVAYRCNIVTLSDEGEYDEKIMLDHSADEITTAEADELIKAEKKALSLLSYADNNRRTLKQKLLRAGFGYEICDTVCEKMLSLGYIDENRQLERLILVEANTKLRGPERIIPALVAKGYSMSDIKAVMRELVKSGEIDFNKNARALISKKLPDADIEEKRKFLYKNGYKI